MQTVLTSGGVLSSPPTPPIPCLWAFMAKEICNLLVLWFIHYCCQRRLIYNNLTIMHWIWVCVFVCFLIKLVPCRESAQDAPCQLRDWVSMFMEGCCSPSCLVAEECNSFVHSPHAIFKIIDPSTTIGRLDTCHAS